MPNRIFIDTLFLDFGHSGIDPLQTRREGAGAVRKLGEVWWGGRHDEMTQPPMPLQQSPHLAAIFLLSDCGENGQSRVFVIALINRRDQYHQQALDLAEQFEGAPLLVTDAVLLEIGNALARSYRQEAVEIIEQFLAADEVEVLHLTPRLFAQGFALYKSHQDKAWGLIDCISFIVMREAGVNQALTFDQHFVQAGFQALMREIPRI